MKLRRKSEPGPGEGEGETIEAFYARNADLDPYLRESSRMMHELVRLLEQHELSFQQRLLTSHMELCIGPALVGAEGCRYEISTPYLDDKAPWPHARLIWMTNDEQRACDILLHLFACWPAAKHQSSMDELKSNFFLEAQHLALESPPLRRISAQAPQALEEYYRQELWLTQGSLGNLETADDLIPREKRYVRFYLERRRRELKSYGALDLLPYLKAEGLGKTYWAYTSGEHELDLIITKVDDRAPGVTLAPRRGHFHVSYPMGRQDWPWVAAIVRGHASLSTEFVGNLAAAPARDQEEYRQALIKTARMAAIAAGRMFEK